MSLIRLLHALATGAATFVLNPTVPAAKTMPLRKSANEALAGDAIKLKCDFQTAFGQLTAEAEARGQSVQAET